MKDNQVTQRGDPRGQSTITGWTGLYAQAGSWQLAHKAVDSGETYIHFPSTSGEVEKERHLQLAEGFQVFSKSFPGELLESILVALGSFFHFTFLIEGERVKTHPLVEFTLLQRTRQSQECFVWLR